MASEQLQKSLSLLKRSRKYRELMRKKSRQLHLEQLEDRRVMAVAGPTLAVLTTNNGEQLLSDSGVPLTNTVIKANPRELNFLFAEGQKIDSATLAGLQVVRAGVDGLTGTGDDITITPGYVGLLDNPRSVVMRFSEALPDDAYLVTVVGSGAAPLKDQSGLPFNGGANLNVNFQLNAGAQIQAVVPQPVSRGSDISNPLKLSQAADTVVVYFNNDQLNANPNLAGNVQNPAFYQLINAATLDIALPSTVTYSFNATTNTNQAVLKFATNLAKGTYKLQIGSVIAPSNTLATAIHEGGPIDGLHAYIGDNPTPAAAQANDVDLYRFELSTTSNFTATLTSVGALNGALRIFDANGNAIVGVSDATGVGGIETRTILNLGAGIYYVGVSSTGNVAYQTNGTLAAGGLTAGAYTLSVNFATPVPGLNVQQTSFVDATANANLGVLGQAGLTVSGSINTLPYDLVFPGASDTPGHRDIPDESHLGGLPATDTTSVAVYPYNFQDVYGTNPQTGLPFHNAITENQKARAREVLQLYSRYAGIEFVETANLGITIATGDLRAISITVPTGGSVLGLADPLTLRTVMNAGVNWGNSEYGGQWFQTAMHEIGHVLGLDHAYDLPGLTIMGAGNEDLAQQYRLGTIPGEPVFPGDADILHTQSLYRPASRDINLYQFTLTEAGQWSAETIAERSRATVSTNFGGSAATMQFDSVLYDAAGNGTQVVITRSNRGAGVDPGISVNLVTRVVSIDLNSNANGTTADRLALLLNGNTDVTRLLTAKVVSAPGTGSTQIGVTAPAAQTLTLIVNSSLLDSVITVYQETQDVNTGVITRTQIARNDDYYGKDSFVDLHLGAGKYYVAVTSKGNTDFDPTVPDSGLGGTTEGAFQLKMNFQADGRYAFVQDVFGTAIDGDADGRPGGKYEFDFQAGPTIFVDKLTTYAHTGTLGSITNPYSTISAALASAPAALASQGANGVQLIRIVGNGGTDGIVTTTGNNLPYLVGFNYNNSVLADGQDFLVPKGVTVMVDAGAIIKFRKANIDVGSSAQGVDRSHAAIQVLGTPNVPAWFTAFGNDVLGGDSNGTTAPISGEWGGIVMRADSDYDHQANPIYLNYVNHANMTYGGGKVVVNSIESVYNPLHMISSRPTLSFNTITLSADAAISADPNSFDDSFGRLGPTLHANKFLNPLTQESNTLNGLLVRIRTQFGSPVDVLTLNGRFHSTDIVYIVPEDFYINGSPGGPTFNGTSIISRPSARLLIDPGVTVKFTASRIEARIGSQLIAEGTANDPIIFTALNDNRYGSGGTFKSQRAGNPLPTTLVPLGLWSGLFFGADSQGSLDNVHMFFAGGNSPIEGGFASFSPIEAYQGDVRVANSLFQYNQNGQGPGGDRNGRGSNASTGGATFFIRGAQPIIVNNIIRDNAGQVASINANAMQVVLQSDYGRSTGLLSNFPQFADNAGPLVRLNRLTNNGINGLEVRGGTLTTATTWDDTDIAHVLRQEIIVPNFHSVGGLTLRSAPNESLVVKALGATAGFTASGTMLDINDRAGGSLYVLGQPGYPVVLTSLSDDSVSAGLDPNGLPVFDTNNDGSAATGGGSGGIAPVFPPATGPLQVAYNNNAQALVNGMTFRPLPAGVTITNPVYSGAATAAGTYINGDAVPLQILSRGIILTTGDANIPVTNTTSSFGVDNGLPGDPDLLGLVGSQFSIQDATSLTLTINVAANSPIRSGSFDFQFGSEEYDEFVGSPFNDVFGGFINGGSATNFVRDSQGNLVTINTGFFDVNNLNGGLKIEYDGLTSRLTANFPLHVGTNVLKLAVGDGADGIYDSGVLITDLRFSATDVGTGGLGSSASAGDWRGLKLDQNSNDRNVKTVYETENVFAGSTSSHGDPQTAQFLGNLAPDVKSGDDNRKLGFQVNGNISLNNPKNVDVYSFTGDSGTEVWLDLSNTSASLQGVLELVDANGGVIARSIVRSPDHNLTMVNQLTGLAANMNKDAQNTTASTNFGINGISAVFTANASGPMYINFQSAALGVGVAPAISVVGQVITVTMNSDGTTLQQLVNTLNTNAQSKLLIQTRFTGDGTTSIGPTGSISFGVPELVAAYAGRDYYSQNPLDPGFRVVLPGDGLKGTTYFVRVRSQGAADGSQDNLLDKGLTAGNYQLNIRLRQMDEVPGSQIRYSTISNATIGIDVQGLPLHSLLAGESTMALNGPNNSFGSALDMGNLLTADRNAISVAGNLAGIGDVQWFSFNIDYDLIQAIAGVNAGAIVDKTWSTIFDFDYSDGLARPDATISVFDATGALIWVGRDSQVTSDQPAAGQGVDLDDTSRGSVGVLDPYIGPVQLPAGTPGQTHRYYVMVSSNRNLPSAMDGTFQLAATTPALRLEPVDSLRRIIDDHIGSQGGATAAAPETAAFPTVNLVSGLKNNVTPYNLSDVQLYVAGGNSLQIVDPYAPASTAHPIINVGAPGWQWPMNDITMRSDGTMFGYMDILSHPIGDDNAGQLVTIDPATGAATVVGTDNIPRYDPTANPPNPQSVNTDRPTAFAMKGHASLSLGENDFSDPNGMFLYYVVPDQFDPAVSRLYRANPVTATAAVTPFKPWGRVGQVITDGGYATASATFLPGNAPGTPNVTFTAQNVGALGTNVRITFVRVFDGNKPAAAVTAANILAKTLTIEINGLSVAARASTNFGLTTSGGANIVTASFAAVQPGAAGNNIRVVLQTGDLGPNVPPTVLVNGTVITVTMNTNPSANGTSATTAADLKAALDGDALANALITTTIGGAATTDITQRPPSIYGSPFSLTGGRDPANAQDVANAVNNSALAFPLLQNNAFVTGDPTVNITGVDPALYNPVSTAGGTNGLVQVTTGTAFNNDGTLWGVSDSGAFYQINLQNARAINPIIIPGAPSFTGLTAGPQNLYNGAYKDLFFATTTTGLVYAINKAGQVQTVFGANDALDPIPTSTTVQTGTVSPVGLVFSPLDFNLFHPTTTRRDDPGHGLKVSPDNNRVVNVAGGTSFYFGFEKNNPALTSYLPLADNPSIGTTSFVGSRQTQYGILTNTYQDDLSVNPTIGGNYNLPGGAHGSLITESFSLQGYTPYVKPTLYFSYLEETAHNVWVSISTDNGVTWQPVAGNGDGTTRQQYVGLYLSNISPSTADPKPAFISASTTEAPSNPFQVVQHLWNDGSNWRQARIDLSQYANLPNLRLQFNVSTYSNGFYTDNGISNLQHEGFYLDDIMVGFAGRGEMVTSAAPGVTGFFTTPTPVKEVPVLLPPPNQVSNGPYQLEIRRGTEYAIQLSPLASKITLTDSYDPRDNFVPDDRDVIQDGFEHGAFNPALNWVNNSPGVWRITNTANATGSYSVQSGTASFSPSQTSDLSFTVKTGTGQVSFSRKVSSNVGSGYLRFYIDNVLQGEWTGEIPMGKVFFPVSPTLGHTFRWSYQKDSADSPTTGILDTAWIDDVRYQAADVDFEGSSALPAIFQTSLTPDQIDHFYDTPPGSGTLFNRLDQGENLWFVTLADSNTGNRSVRSAVLSPNMTSKLSTVKQIGEETFSFAYKVVGNGTLTLRVDGALRLTATATGGWVTSTLNLSAGYHNFVWLYTTAATVAATDAAFLDDIVFPMPNIGTGSIGDENQYREQGSIVIEANKITNSLEIGIAVRPAQRGAGGNLPYPSSVISSPTLNNSQLVDGVSIFNNVVANSGQVGILFAGDPNNGLPAAAVPFGRIFNNTVYGGDTPTGTGILVQNNAGPTLLNNIVANNVLGISVDASSSRVVNGAPNTVIGTTLYQGNTTDIAFAGTQTNPIVLALGAPLFVDPRKQNFYLADGSRAIDSSVDKLDDRFNYAAVKNPLAIAQSPIIAPLTDLFGQLRADDPNNDPTGGGQNVFKDLGAIDRVDFEQPTARLVGPLDNDPAGLDLDPTADTVLLNNQTIHSFDIQLADVGIGVDDGSIKSSQFVITEDGTTLVDGVDYIFVYNANKHLVTFLPSSGTWRVDLRYVITLDNSVATGIKDIAGNTLLPNKSTGPDAGKTVFVVFNGVLYSYGTAPDPYPTLLADDGPRHLIVPGMYLGTFVQPRLDGQPTAMPNGDGDGGISNISFVSGLNSHFDVTASIAGKLDVWIDLNQDEQFEDSEHVVNAQNIPAGTSTVTFALGTVPSGTTIARFRYSSAGIAFPTGEALDGEVDDYQVTVNGPPFQNPSKILDLDGNNVGFLDVTGDGFISPIDALRVINLINRYYALFPGGGNIPLPNVLTNPTGPDFVDTDGDGILAPHDALLVRNYLNNPVNNPPPNGEGEGESDGVATFSVVAASSSSSADAVGAGVQNAIPPVLYGNSSVVLEVKSNTSSTTQAVDQVFGSGQSLAVDNLQPVLESIHPATRRELKIEAKSRPRSESDDSWDDLLGDLAADIGKRRTEG